MYRDKSISRNKACAIQILAEEVYWMARGINTSTRDMLDYHLGNEDVELIKDEYPNEANIDEPIPQEEWDKIFNEVEKGVRKLALQIACGEEITRQIIDAEVEEEIKAWKSSRRTI